MILIGDYRLIEWTHLYTVADALYRFAAFNESNKIKNELINQDFILSKTCLIGINTWKVNKLLYRVTITFIHS